MKYKLLLLALCLCFCAYRSGAAVKYVDSSHVGGLQTGASWATAYADLQAGIDAAAAGDSVWVAKGIYQSPSFTGIVMKEGVKILGGFLNTHTSAAQRNWTTNVTTIRSSNYRALINNGNNLTTAALLDGFRVIGNGNNFGNGSGGMYNNLSSPTIANCTFSQHRSSEGAAIFNRSCSPVIVNCTFTNNYANDNSAPYRLGGAIQNFNASPLISNCTFTANQSTDNGGAIYNINASSPVISNCTFNSNSSDKGGAIYSNGTGNTVTVSHCSFTNNTGGQIVGAAIYTEGGTLINISNCSFTNHANTPIVNGATCNIDSCTFSANTGFYGGAVYNYASLSISNSSFTGHTNTYDGGVIYSIGAMTLNRCAFSGNTGGLGGALYIGSPATIRNCSFRGNKSGDLIYGGGYGGGIYFAAACTLVNCLFTGNVASNGAAFYNAGPMIKMINCTVAGNRSPYDTYNNHAGSGIFNWGAGTLQIANSIVYGNQYGIVTESMATTTATYSLIQGLTPAPGSHNISGDPQFVDVPYLYSAPYTSGDFRLQNASICINKGRNDSIPTGIVTDLDTNARIIADTVDMGAFENIGGGASLAQWAVQLTASSMQTGQALLSWQVLGAKQVATFELQRSNNGFTFSTLTVMAAKSGRTDRYDFTDNTPGDRAFYRLLVKDTEGSQSYSNTVLLTSNRQQALVSVYPNPVKDKVYIVSKNAGRSNFATLYNATGNLISTIPLADEVTLMPLTGLPAGIYLLRINEGSVFKLIKE